jgi:hypothetical protein
VALTPCLRRRKRGGKKGVGGGGGLKCGDLRGSSATVTGKGRCGQAVLESRSRRRRRGGGASDGATPTFKGSGRNRGRRVGGRGWCPRGGGRKKESGGLAWRRAAWDSRHRLAVALR